MQKVFDGTSKSFDKLGLKGWGQFEGGAFWSIGNFSQITISADNRPRSGIKSLSLEIMPLLCPEKLESQPVAIYVNGLRCKSLNVMSGPLEVNVPVYKDASNGPIVVDFDFPFAASPADLEMGDDDRKLAIMIRSIAVI